MKIAKWSRMLFILSLLIMTALMVAACQPAASPTAEGSTTTGGNGAQAPAPIVTVTEVAGPYIKISDQAIPNKRVILDESWSEVAGWLDIYNDKDGKANEIIGYGTLAEGRNMNSRSKWTSPKPPRPCTPSFMWTSVKLPFSNSPGWTNLICSTGTPSRPPSRLPAVCPNPFFNSSFQAAYPGRFFDSLD